MGILKPFILGLLVAAGLFLGLRAYAPQKLPIRLSGVKPTPTIPHLRKYSIRALQNRAHETNVEIRIQNNKVVEPADSDGQHADYSERTFSFNTEGYDITGRLVVPNVPGTYPVVIMIRGYVDQESYAPGVGTARSANYLASQGYVTLAPDFLGYAGSDESPGGLEDRFLTYTTVLDLIGATSSFNDSLEQSDLEGIFVDPNKVALWGHSNGGQIALTVLAATEKPIPTVLWAPVSKPFPYSVLYYSDEAPDDGKSLRKLIADFEQNYQADDYSLTNYLDQIKAPIRIHQGTSDESVPISWTQGITTKLEEAEIDVETTYYEAEDHNFNQGSWEKAIRSTEVFFKEQFVFKNE